MLLIISIFALTIFFAILGYFLLVPAGVFWSTYFFLGLYVIMLLGIIFAAKKNKKKEDEYEDSRIAVAVEVVAGAVGIYLVITLVIWFSPCPMFTANSYKSILPAPTVKEFNKEIEPFDISKAPIVTKSTAIQIADKCISQDGSLGSRASMNEITLQSVKGDLYWVAPLEHSGLFAWKNNKDEGTPYVMVNANTKECKLVKAHIKYQAGSFFSQDLARKLFFTNMGYGYTDFTFEINDEGKPYWTVSVYKNTIGFGGAVVVGTGVVDAENGEVNIYSIKDTPSWVDRIQPIEFVVKNIDWSGKYIHGFSPFNDNNKFESTEGTGIVYNEGKCYYYTGITSIGKDAGTLGFYLVDTRTMETTYFQMSGATETAAINSAEGKVQNLGYKGSFPILMNVENTPTYFIPLQDKNDLTKMYAMVSVEDYTIIATGDTVDECKEAYSKALFSKNKLSNTKGDKKQITGIVKRIGSYTQQGNTFYTMQLDKSNLLFVIPANQSIKLPITKEGDNILIKYIDIKDGASVSSSEFDNISIK